MTAETSAQVEDLEGMTDVSGTSQQGQCWVAHSKGGTATVAVISLARLSEGFLRTAGQCKYVGNCAAALHISQLKRLLLHCTARSAYP